MTRHTLLKRLRTLASLAVVVTVFAIWAVALRPESLGGSVMYIVVRGTSMLPTYSGGDLVLVRDQPAYKVGDAVAYRVPDGEFGAGGVVIHRIVGGDGASGFVMLGDNNETPDPWAPQADDIVGKAWFMIPGIGGFIATVRQPAVIGALGAAVVVAVILTRSPAPVQSGADAAHRSRWFRRRPRSGNLV